MKISENILINKFNFEELVSNNSNASTFPTHNIHKFYAKLIPHIPRFLINKYSEPQDLVLDPFCGSGTTLLEARISKRNSIGLDINPLAVLISDVKTHKYNINELEYAVNLFKANISTQNNTLKVEFPNIKHWFSQKTRFELEKIKSNLEAIKIEISEESYKFLLVCFSSIIRRSSYADNKISKIYKSKRVINKIKMGWEPKPIKYYLKNIEIYFQKVKAYSNLLNNNENHVVVFHEDVKLTSERLIKKKISSVDLIITSPPYINAQNYFRSYKLELFWLGLISPLELRDLNKKVIGNEITTNNDLKKKPYSKIFELNPLLLKVWNKSKKRAYIIQNYFENMEIVVKSLFQILKYKGYLCIIIGNNTICGYQIPTNFFLIKLFKFNGFKLIKIYKDKIRRRSLNPNRNHNCGSINEEWIIIFKKE